MTDRALLEMWVIYDHPSDHPNGFIARKHVSGAVDGVSISGATMETLDAPTLDELREKPPRDWWRSAATRPTIR